MSEFAIFLVIWWGVAAILLCICGYNDLGETPAPIFAVVWPVVVPFAMGVFLLLVLPVKIGVAIRERLT